MLRPTASLGLEFMDRRVRVAAGDAEFRRDLARCFGGPRAWPARPADTAWHLRVDVGPPAPDGPRAVASEPGGLPCPWTVLGPEDLCGLLEHWAVGASERHYAFHAGAVAREGRALGLPGPSGSGKSTLTAALLAAGYDYLSDEVCAVDMKSFAVDPHPRCLKLRAGALAPLGLAPDAGLACRGGEARVVRPSALGAARGVPGAVLAAFVHPRFEPGAAARLTPLRPAEAVLLLMESACSQQRHKVAGLDWVIGAARRTLSFDLVYGDLDQAVAAVESVFP